MDKNDQHYEAILFDIGGVLELTGPMDFATRWEQSIGLPDNTILGGLADEWMAGAIGGVTIDELRRVLAGHLHCSDQVASQILDDMWDQYLGVANVELIEWLREHRRFYRTALVSNSFVGAREREENRYRFSEIVDTIVYSHEVGWLKPDPRIYLSACEQLGVDPKRCIFVDDAEAVINGARELGMTAVLHANNATTVRQLNALAPTLT